MCICSSSAPIPKRLYLILWGQRPRMCILEKAPPTDSPTPSPAGWLNKGPSPQPCVLSSGNCFAEKLVFSLPNVIAQKVIVRKMWLVRAGSGRLSEAPDALSSALGGQMAKEPAALFLQLHSLGLSPFKCIRMRTESQLSFVAVFWGLGCNIRPHHAVDQPKHWLCLRTVLPWLVIGGSTGHIGPKVGSELSALTHPISIAPGDVLST